MEGYLESGVSGNLWPLLGWYARRYDVNQTSRRTPLCASHRMALSFRQLTRFLRRLNTAATRCGKTVPHGDRHKYGPDAPDWPCMAAARRCSKSANKLRKKNIIIPESARSRIRTSMDVIRTPDSVAGGLAVPVRCAAVFGAQSFWRWRHETGRGLLAIKLKSISTPTRSATGPGSGQWQ